MRYDVEVRSQINGNWERRYFTVEADTGDEAAARAKHRAVRALPDASLHLSYAVRPSETGPDIKPSAKLKADKPAKRAPAKKRRTV